METAAVITIMILAATVATLAYKCVALSYKVGKYETEREARVVPEINMLREDNSRLFRDIEKILEGDQYVIGVHKEIIERKKRIPDYRKYIK